MAGLVPAFTPPTARIVGLAKNGDRPLNLVETAKRIMVATGAQAILWLLIALSVISFATILERAWVFARRRGNVEELRSLLLAALGEGGFDRATRALSGVRHPAAVVALRGLSL